MHLGEIYTLIFLRGLYFEVQTILLIPPRFVCEVKEIFFRRQRLHWIRHIARPSP